jgi:hypothetical protein
VLFTWAGAVPTKIRQPFSSAPRWPTKIQQLFSSAPMRPTKIKSLNRPARPHLLSRSRVSLARSFSPRRRTPRRHRTPHARPSPRTLKRHAAAARRALGRPLARSHAVRPALRARTPRARPSPRALERRRRRRTPRARPSHRALARRAAATTRYIHLRLLCYALPPQGSNIRTSPSPPPFFPRYVGRSGIPQTLYGNWQWQGYWGG